MIGIVLVTHGRLADEFVAALTHIVGPQERIGTVCIYQATSAEAVREHAGRVDMPADEVLECVDTVVVRPDPTADSAAA